MARGLVVGAAVLRDGRVLAARRTAPAPVAGRWELPGGKVEPGEPPAAAVERELAEELGVDVEVTGWLPGRVPVSADLELAVATVVLRRGDPEPREHDELRWVDGAGLDDLDWLGPDRPFLPALARVLAGATGVTGATGGARRAIVFDEDGARALAVRLVGGGFDARVERERLAGEDDDDDHPWAVVTDAPSDLVEVLVDEHDGWWEEEGPAADAPAPALPLPPLPTAPRRVRRADRDVGGPH